MKQLRNFPWFIKKTDEERIQNMPWVFEQRHGSECYITEKIDGTSGTFAVYYGKKKFSWLSRLLRLTDSFYVCSRNLSLSRSNCHNVYWGIVKKGDIEKKLKSVGKNIAIQGEIYGEGIQKNKYKLEGIHLAIFNVIDIDENRYYNIGEKLEFCEQYGFQPVGMIHWNFIINKDMTVKDIVEIAKGKSILNNKVKREGIVIRDINNDRLSFKVVNPEFLLQYEE